MNNRVGKRQIEDAKSVNLIIYLQIKRPELICEDIHCKGRYIHPEHDSLVITERGFFQFSVGLGGDQIQFLQNYVYNGDFIAAVQDLASYAAGCSLWDFIEPEKSTEKSFLLPPKENGLYKRVWAYLVKKRNIPSKTIQELFDEGTLYQTAKYGNCAFVSKECNYAELVGTGETRFKGIVQGSDQDGYWITGATNPEKVYVCESAIDAISLKVLHEIASPDNHNNAYASIGGLKPQAMQRLLAKYPDKCILAVDNDDAANAFADKFSELERAIPSAKDWNELLKEEADII